MLHTAACGREKEVQTEGGPPEARGWQGHVRVWVRGMVAGSSGQSEDRKAGGRGCGGVWSQGTRRLGRSVGDSGPEGQGAK